MHKLDKIIGALGYPHYEFRTTDGRVSGAAMALSVPVDTAAQIEDFKSIAEEDTSVTREMTRSRVKGYAERVSQQAKQYLVSAQIKTAKEIEAITNRIAFAFKPGDAGEEARKTAILENLAALPRKQRDDTIRQALMSGDRETITALATRPYSPRYCIPYVHAEAKDALARMAVGKDVDVLADLQDADKELANALIRFDSFITAKYITPALEGEAKAERAKEMFMRAEWVDPETKEFEKLKEELNNEQ